MWPLIKITCCLCVSTKMYVRLEVWKHRDKAQLNNWEGQTRRWKRGMPKGKKRMVRTLRGTTMNLDQHDNRHFLKSFQPEELQKQQQGWLMCTMTKCSGDDSNFFFQNHFHLKQSHPTTLEHTHNSTIQEETSLPICYMGKSSCRREWLCTLYSAMSDNPHFYLFVITPPSTYTRSSRHSL